MHIAINCVVTSLFAKICKSPLPLCFFRTLKSFFFDCHSSNQITTKFFSTVFYTFNISLNSSNVFVIVLSNYSLPKVFFTTFFLFCFILFSRNHLTTCNRNYLQFECLHCIIFIGLFLYWCLCNNRVKQYLTLTKTIFITNRLCKSFQIIFLFYWQTWIDETCVRFILHYLESNMLEINI